MDDRCFASCEKSFLTAALGMRWRTFRAFQGRRRGPSASMWGHVGGGEIPGRVGSHLIEIIELFPTVAFSPLNRQETHISCGFLRCLGESRTPPNAQTTPHPPTFPALGKGLRAQFAASKRWETYAGRRLSTGLTALPLAAP